MNADLTFAKQVCRQKTRQAERSRSLANLIVILYFVAVLA